MRLIKNAIVYRASLPAAAALAEHLAEKPFTPVLESHFSSSGFIPHPTTKDLVSQFPGGYAFRMRLDNCSHLPFHTMPVHRQDGTDVVVICTQFVPSDGEVGKPFLNPRRGRRL